MQPQSTFLFASMHINRTLEFLACYLLESIKWLLMTKSSHCLRGFFFIENKCVRMRYFVHAPICLLLPLPAKQTVKLGINNRSQIQNLLDNP